MRILLTFIILSVLFAQGVFAVFSATANFDLYPAYVPKNATPFAFKVCYSGLAPNTDFDLKAAIGNSDGSSQASKVWSGSAWISSNNYGPTLVSNSTGEFCSIVYLQTNPAASAYGSLIENNANAYLTTKLRKSDQTTNTSSVSSVQINLLDLCEPDFPYDCYGSGGFGGGWLEGFYPSLPAGSVAKIKNNTQVVSLYTLENNNVLESYPANNGYFKLAAPEGNFTLEISDATENILKTENISILQNETTYAGNVLYLLISSNIETENFGSDYKAAPNQTYKVFLIENLEYSKILGQNLSIPIEINFSWNITNATLPSQVFSSGSTTENFIESLDTAEWTPTVNGNYTVCGTINSEKVNGSATYNIAPRWASPEDGDYGDTYCINITVGINKTNLECTVLAGIETEQDIFESKDFVSFWLRLNSTASHDVAVKWWIEDYTGAKVKQKYFSTPANTTTILIDKSWDAKKIGNFTIRANVTDFGCVGSEQSSSEKQITVLPKDSLEVSASLDKTKFNFSDNATITVRIANGFSSEKNGNLIVAAKRRLSIFGYNEIIANETLAISANSLLIKNYTWRIPADSISGDYRIKVSFVYDKTKSKYPTFSVAGLTDLGEPSIEIISTSPAKFGEFALVFVKYAANNYNLPLKFLSYLYSPWLSTDLSGETLRSNLENSNVAASINTTRDNTYYILLPIILKNNCDSKLADSLYSAKARVYYSGNALLDKNFNISIAGSNSARCPTVSEKEVEKIRDLGGVKKIYEIVKELENVEVEIKNLESEISGDTIDFIISAKNIGTSSVIVDAYSFIEKDGELISASEISTKKINAGSKENFEIRNKIPPETYGNYTIHIRISDGKLVYETEKAIEIKKAVSKNKNIIGSDTPTGRFISGASTFISNFVNGLISFFAGIFKSS